MRTIGLIAIIVVAVAVLGVIAMVAMSLGDIRRYLAIRRM